MGEEEPVIRLKNTYVQVRKRKRRRRFPADIIKNDTSNSFSLFDALNASNIRKYKTDKRCVARKKPEKQSRVQHAVHFNTTPVDLKSLKQKRAKKKDNTLKTEKKGCYGAANTNKFVKPEIKVLGDAFSPDTTFDRLLRSSRNPLGDRTSMNNVMQNIRHNKSGVSSPLRTALSKDNTNRTSTPILPSHIFRSADSLLTPVLANRPTKGSTHSGMFLDAAEISFPVSPHVVSRKQAVTEFCQTSAQNHKEKCAQIETKCRKCFQSETEKLNSTNSDGSFILSVNLRPRRNKRHCETKSSSGNDVSESDCDEIKRSCTENSREIKSNQSGHKYDGSSSIQTRSKTKNIDSESDSEIIRCARNPNKTLFPPDDPSSSRNSQSECEYEKIESYQNSVESFFSASRVRPEREIVSDKCKTHKSVNNENDTNGDKIVSVCNSCGSSKRNIWSESECDANLGHNRVVTCKQLMYASINQSPDMFSSLDDIETYIHPQCVPVITGNRLRLSARSSCEGTSSLNILSDSTTGGNCQKASESSISNTHSSYVSIPGSETQNNQTVPVQVIENGNVDTNKHSIENDGSSNLQHTVALNLSNAQLMQNSQITVTADVYPESTQIILPNNICNIVDTNYIYPSDSDGLKQCCRKIRDTAYSYPTSRVSSSVHTHLVRSMSQFDGLRRTTQETPSSKNVLRVTESCLKENNSNFGTRDRERDAETSQSRVSIRKTSLCRRHSHIIIPTAQLQERSFSLSLIEERNISPSVSVIIEDEELLPEDSITWNRGVKSARATVLGRCNQSEPISFDMAFPNRYLDSCKKIGEGLYGEVFLCKHDDAPGRVLKIVPIEGHILVNGEKQKKYHEVLSELVITMELSNLRNDVKFRTDCFVEVTRCLCVQGKYPQKLTDLWFQYNDEKVSENDPPTIFDDQQIFIVFELADAGISLEAYSFASAAQACSAFVQLAFTLATAERTLEFEHRDLHWGNVLIRKTSDRNIIFKLDGEEFSVPSNGIKVTIIDFTLSRMSYDGCCIFNDLAVDPEIFASQGDYQFEVYRLMQNAVKNEWHHFQPRTNIFWLHYILDKMLTIVRYRSTSSKTHKKFKNTLKQCYTNVLKYNSAYELVTAGNILHMMK